MRVRPGMSWSKASRRERRRIAQAGVPANRSSFAGWRTSEAQSWVASQTGVLAPLGRCETRPLRPVHWEQTGPQTLLSSGVESGGESKDLRLLFGIHAKNFGDRKLERFHNAHALSGIVQGGIVLRKFDLIAVGSRYSNCGTAVMGGSQMKARGLHPMRERRQPKAAGFPGLQSGRILCFPGNL